MTPKQFSHAMRHIAAKIENSKNPSRRLVAMELRRVLAAVDAQNAKVWVEQTEFDNKSVLAKFDLPPSAQDLQNAAMEFSKRNTSWSQHQKPIKVDSPAWGENVWELGNV